MQIDTYEVIRLLTVPRIWGLILSLLIGFLAAAIVLKKSKSVALVLVSVFTIWGLFVVRSIKVEYALMLLSSENDLLAEQACYYVAESLNANRLSQLIENVKLSPNTRYYLAVALNLKDERTAATVLLTVPDFEKPRFFSTNRLNIKVKSGDLHFPMSGRSLESLIKLTLIKTTVRDEN